MTEDCIFCKIVEGKIPSAKLYEDGDCIAFLDISPAVKGHTLVVPKKHHETLLDITEEGLKALMIKVRSIAKSIVDATSADGFNLLQNNKKIAGQMIPHIHFHIIPRYPGDGQDFSWKHVKYGEGEMEEYKNSIKKRL